MAWLSLLAAVSMLPAQAPTGVQAAWEYARARDSYGMVVMRGGAVVFEAYLVGGPETPHPLASGTKSFLGPLVATMVASGEVRWDERLSDTLTEWRADGRREITVRQALSLTSGLQRMPPGTVFAYGPANYLAMTEFLSRKLAMRGETVESRLNRSIFAPLGIAPTFQPTLDGYPNLAGGGSASFAEWRTYGEMLRNGGVHGGRTVVDPDALRELTRGSPANPGYGSTFWLPASDGAYLPGFTLPPNMPKDAFVAAGAGGQLLVVAPSRRTVLVRLGTMLARRPDGFQATEFLARFFDEEQRAPSAPRRRG